MSEVKMYFKGGAGIENPVDVNGNPIVLGSILTHCYFEKDMDNFFKHHYPHLTPDDIIEVINRPSVVVRQNEKGILFGEGIYKTLYMHDFRFKYTKLLGHENDK